MKTKDTVRLLVFDPAGRLLLMQIENRLRPDPITGAFPLVWITLGGKIEPGETVEEAALREGLEETGHTLTLERRVFYGEQVLVFDDGVETLVRETFVLARIPDVSLDFAGFTDRERAIVRNVRFWSPAELAQTRETVLPLVLKDLVVPLSRGEIADDVRTIPL